MCDSSIVTSVADLPALIKHVSIYPNPSDEYFSIKSDDIFIDVIYIYDLEGRLIKSINNFVNKVDVSDMEVGIYYVEIIDHAGRRLVEKICVQR